MIWCACQQLYAVIQFHEIKNMVINLKHPKLKRFMVTPYYEGLTNLSVELSVLFYQDSSMPGSLRFRLTRDCAHRLETKDRQTAHFSEL
jgi:hypothetical protein